MPEYFFHVALELLPDPDVDIDHRQVAQSSNNSTVTQALSPFAKHSPHPNPFRTPNTGGCPSENKLKPPRALATVPSHALRSSPHDQRLDDITIESMDMTRGGRAEGISVQNTNGDKTHVGTGIGTVTNGLQTKGHYVPLDKGTSDSVWGIVHLYRDIEETPGLYGDTPLSRPTDPWLHGYTKDSIGPKHPPPADQDCTTLCILAVPSYMSPSDFLGFVGEATVNEVSHFRMIRTARANRYMVLMKFRNGKKAREWQQEWNGKLFNSVEVCQ